VELVAALALAAAIAALVIVALLARETLRLRRRLAMLTRDGDGRSLETILDAHLRTVLEVRRRADTLEARTTALETKTRATYRRAGLVRFNPFEDTGSNQSFVIALLDDEGDGLLLSSLHSRSGTRIYAKPVRGGRAETTISDEEGEAIRLARGR